MDVFGKALRDFYHFGETDTLWLHNNYGDAEEMPLEAFFRTGEDIPELEEHAISLCHGKVLDIGAGAGVHSLMLQARDMEVTALEISAAACDIMRERGVHTVIQSDVFLVHQQYDTLLLLMNGIGLCGDLAGLNTLLPHLKANLRTGGQIILDSSDIAYLYDGSKIPENYYGEISYQYEYQSVKGDWFKWLYVDFPLLQATAKTHGLSCELVYQDDMDQYLARLMPFS